MSKIKQFMRGLIKLDGWSNAYTGLGTTRDKMTYSTFEGATKVGDEELDALYHGDDMAARACDAVPEEMLRCGFEIKSDDIDSETLSLINDSLTALETKAKFTDSATWARVFGGCVIYIGADDGAQGAGLQEPLNEGAIKKLDHLNVIDRRYAYPLEWYTDPSDPKFGKPKTYMISSDGSGSGQSVSVLPVHESRLIRFDGLRASVTYRQENNGWGLSLLQRMNQILQDYGMSFQSLAHLLSDANQGVLKMKGLFEALAAKDVTLIQQRMQLIDMSRSDVRAIVLDAEDEDFIRQNFNWSGIDKPFTMMMLRLSAAARIPVTILMGQSPTGMDATGESDIRWFYDQTESHRESYLEAKLRRIIKLLTLSKDGPTGGKELENYTIYWPPLWQATETEKATIRKTQAEADKIYIETGVVFPEEIALSRFTADGWSSETEIDIEMREDMLEDMKSQPAEPEPDPIEPPEDDEGEEL
jgi:phage-related protein (TIGR01555 family)